MLTNMTMLERLLFLKRIQGGGSGHEETSTTGIFDTDMVAPLRKLLLQLNPIQSGSGDPSPSNVRPISGWTEVTATRTGKNLLDLTTNNIVQGAISSADASDTSVASRCKTNGYVPVLASEQYTASVDISGTSNERVFILEYSGDSQADYLNISSGWQNAPYTFTTSANTTHIRIVVANLAGTNIIPSDVLWMQLEVGSTATAYEPYAGQSYVTEWGKNLLNPNDPNWGNYTIGPDGEQITSSADRITTGYIPCKPDTYITVSTEINTSGSKKWNFVGVAYYDNSKTFLSRSYRNNLYESYTVQAPANTAYIRFFEQIQNLSSVTSPSVFATYKQQLEFSSTASAYTPYKAGIIYGGTLDMVSGVLTVDRVKLDASVFDSQLTQGSGNVYVTGSYVLNTLKLAAPIDLQICKCNCLKAMSATSTSVPSFSIGGSGTFAVNGASGITDTVANWRAYVSQNDVYFIFKLATPQTYQLTPQEIKTLIGTNVILTDGTIVEVVYLKKAE